MILLNKIVQTKDEWDAVLHNFHHKDIYFEYNFIQLYVQPGSKPYLIYMETESAKMAYPFILMDISYHQNFNGLLEKNKYFDISTYFGYCGHLIEAEDNESKNQIIKLFYELFSDFCSKNNIVSEFVKFSPVLKNHESLDNIMKIINYKKIAVTNLEKHKNKTCKEVSKTRIKTVEKCHKLGMTTEVILAPKSFDEQLKIYYNSMDRKNASTFYYYPKEYFDKMLTTLSENILLINVMFDKKLVAFGLCLTYDKYIYGLVSGVDNNYVNFSPSNMHYLETINWGCEHGYKFYLSGGGLTTDENDSLYLYKKSFAQSSNYDLYLGNKIWNQELYDYLVNLADKHEGSLSKFFPLYKRTK
ncbi:MAG: GNAT family N-acetyltransferase [Solirubrobacterales bacterium]